MSAFFGLLIQWASDPEKFPVFPPGVALILVCAALIVIRVRWWTPVFAVLISAWILLGGLASGELSMNLGSAHAGTVTGNVVMCVGLAVAAFGGSAAAVNGCSIHKARTDTPRNT